MLSDAYLPYGFIIVLFYLLDEAGCSQLSVIFDEAPPNVGEGDGGGVPKSVSIHESFIWREIIYL